MKIQKLKLMEPKKGPSHYRYEDLSDKFPILTQIRFDHSKLFLAQGNHFLVITRSPMVGCEKFRILLPIVL
ncbi:hypothetical protein L484_022167 [Morus notabilis]|uniref:Uncharacterized protein n=1 Tax=Morus notabilis TaxID=981085 RepID=W9RAJ5_9ROSA|nr:hypothetical protein L484_022167 [Morus notabilis]